MANRNSIDERIVRMQFDNQQFEAGVRETSKTLDEFRGKLDFKNIGSGLDELNSYGSKMNFSTLSNAVDTISSKFTALGVIGFTALQKIADKAIDTGTQLMKSLAIDPITQGFNEYELKMGSVQTIMASTGESLDTVNGYLEELNKYADQTIYSFADMTQNIGKFTNSGVKLEDAVAAIKGISNEAALSGANANEASRAMYNFAQALSSGAVRLIDWKSIENANMATVEFKEQLIETALELETVVKEGDLYKSTTTDLTGAVSDAFNATTGFNDSLKAQWLTSDVLIKTLAKYSSTTSDLGKRAYAAAQDVKTFSQFMDTTKEAVGSGWAQTWEIIFGDFEEAKSLWTMLSNAVGGFVEQQATARNELLKGWKDLAGRTRVIDAIANVFRYLGEVVQPIKNALTQIFPPVTAERLAEISEKFLDFALNLKVSVQESNRLTRIFKGLFSVLDIAKKGITTFLKPIGALVKALSPAKDAFLDFAASVGDYFVNLNKSLTDSKFFENSISSILGFINDGAERFKKFYKAIKSGTSTISPLLSGFKSLFNFLSDVGVSTLTKIQNGINSLFSKVKSWDFSGIQKYFSNLFSRFDPVNNFKDKFDKIITSVNTFTDTIVQKLDPLNRIKGIFDKVASWFTGFANKISEVKIEIGGITGLIERFKAFYEKIKPILTSIYNFFKEIFTELVDFLKALFSGVGFDDAIKLLNEGLLGAIVIVIIKLVNSIANIVKNSDKFVKSIKDIFAGIGDSIKAFQKSVKAQNILTIAIALGILAGALVAMSLVDPSRLGGALISMSTLFGGLILVLKSLGKINNMKDMLGNGTTALIKMGGSILIMAKAIKTLQGLNFGEVVQGLSAVIGLISVLTASLDGFDGTKIQKAGSTMMGMGVAILILVKATESFAQMDFWSMAQGLTAVAGLIMSLGSALDGAGGGLNKSAIGIVALASSMFILYKAVDQFGQMEDIFDLIQGLGPVIGLLTVMGGVIKYIGGQKIALGTSVAIIALAGALKLITDVVVELSAIEFAPLVTGIVGLTGALLAVTATIAGLENVGTGKILGIAAGILAMSAACIVIAKAIQMLSDLDIKQVGTALAGIGGVLGGMVIAALALNYAASGLVPVLLSLGGMIALVGAGVLAAGAGVLMLCSGIERLATLSPEAGEGLVNFINRVSENLPKLGTALGQTINNFITAIQEYMPTGAASIVVAFIVSFTRDLVLALPDLVEAGLKLIVDFLNELADAIDNNAHLLVDAIFRLANSLIKTLGEVLGGAVGLLVEGVVSFGKGIVDGFKGIFGINSPSKETKYVGTQLSAGLSMGLDGGYDGIMKSASGISDGLLDKFSGLDSGMNMVGSDAMSSLVGGFGDLSEFDIQGQLDDFMGDLNFDFPEEFTSPEISPVLDLSNLDGADLKIGEMLNGNTGISLNSIGLGDLLNQNGSNLPQYEPFDDTELVSGIQNVNKGLSEMNQNLSNRIGQLETAIMNMKIYLDSGQLVGGITRKMNSSINQYNSYKRSGVY